MSWLKWTDFDTHPFVTVALLACVVFVVVDVVRMFLGTRKIIEQLQGMKADIEIIKDGMGRIVTEMQVLNASLNATGPTVPPGERFDLVLDACGPNREKVIEILQTLGLDHQEAMNATVGTPCTIAYGVDRTISEQATGALLMAGARCHRDSPTRAPMQAGLPGPPGAR